MKSNVTTATNAINASSGVSATRGHLQDNGGIRGHSAGELFPLLVVGVGTQWEVQHAGKTLFRHWSVGVVHAAGAAIKAGLVPTAPKLRVVYRQDTGKYLVKLEYGDTFNWNNRLSTAAGVRALRSLLVSNSEIARARLKAVELTYKQRNATAKAVVKSSASSLIHTSRALAYLDWVLDQLELLEGKA